MTEYLDLEDILDAAEVAVAPGELLVRDVGLLESAIARPRASAFGEDAYPDLFLKAAALLESIARNHALIDGNKRLAWLATATSSSRTARTCALPARRKATGLSAKSRRATLNWVTSRDS